MAIEITPEARKEAIASLQAYAEVELDVQLGNLAADQLLDFILEEIGPTVYNRAIADVQDRVQARLSEIDVELQQPEFAYRARRGQRSRGS